MPEQEKFDAEKAIKRNPHPDFKKVEASRPPWSKNTLEFTQTAKTDWKLGDGANDGGEGLKKKHVEIDPYEEGRPATFNYKLLISAIVPRPIGFCGTISKDGILYTSQSPNPRTILTFWANRKDNKSSTLLLLQPHKPRPTPLHPRFRRRLRPRKRYPQKHPRNKRMHHKHHLRTHPRSRKQHLHKQPLRNLRMGPLRPHPKPMQRNHRPARRRIHLLHRGKITFNAGIRESSDAGEENGGACNY